MFRFLLSHLLFLLSFENSMYASLCMQIVANTDMKLDIDFCYVLLLLKRYMDVILMIEIEV